MDYRTALDAVWIAKVPAANPANLSEIDSKLGNGIHQKYLSKIRAGELLTNEEIQFAEDGLSQLPADVQLYVIKGIAYALTENSRNYIEDTYPNFKNTILRWLEKLLTTSERGRALARIAALHAVRGEFVEAKQRYAELLGEVSLPKSVATEVSMRMDAIGLGAEEFALAKALRIEGIAATEVAEAARAVWITKAAEASKAVYLATKTAGKTPTEIDEITSAASKATGEADAAKKVWEEKEAVAAGKHAESYKYIEKYRKVASNGTELFNKAEYKNLRAQILVSMYNSTKDEKYRKEAIEIIEAGKTERDSK